MSIGDAILGSVAIIVFLIMFVITVIGGGFE